MKKLKIGIVGIGGIARYAHLTSYGKMENVEIVAACDINDKKMDYELLPKNVKKYKDYKEMIDNADIDAVDICTPNYLHSVIAVYALNAGKHVFCEKPDAINVDEMKKMIEAEKKSGKTLMVMRNNRHLSTSKYLKKFINEGKAGEIYAGRCGWIRRRGIPGKGGWFTTNAQSGGGPLIDLGVHMLDLAVYMMGNPRAVSVSGSTFCKFAAEDEVSDSVHSSFGERVSGGVFDVEDLAMGFIKFDNGACLQLEFSWASNIEAERNFVELRGTKAGFTWDCGKAYIFSEEHTLLTDTKIYPQANDDGHCENLKHFVDVVLNGAKSDYESSQGLNIVNILTAMYRSAKEGKEIQL